MLQQNVLHPHPLSQVFSSSSCSGDTSFFAILSRDCCLLCYSLVPLGLDVSYRIPLFLIANTKRLPSSLIRRDNAIHNPSVCRISAHFPQALKILATGTFCSTLQHHSNTTTVSSFKYPILCPYHFPNPGPLGHRVIHRKANVLMFYWERNKNEGKGAVGQGGRNGKTTQHALLNGQHLHGNIQLGCS